MKKFLFFVVATLFVANSAYAKNDIVRFPIAAALAEPDAKAKLDPNIKFYFGNKSAGRKITQQLSSNKKQTASIRPIKPHATARFYRRCLAFKIAPKKRAATRSSTSRATITKTFS